MALEILLSLTSILVTGLLGIIFFKQFRQQKEQIASLIKATEGVRDINGRLTLCPNQAENQVVSPLKRTHQAHREFKSVPFQEKVVYVQNHGTYLAARQLNEYQINLYHLPGFFVEVWHSQLTDYPNGIRTFTRKDSLDVYTELINLEIE